MKTYSRYLVIALLALVLVGAENAEGRFVENNSSGESKSVESWSWTDIKETVQKKLASFFGSESERNQNSATVRDSAAVAEPKTESHSWFGGWGWGGSKTTASTGLSSGGGNAIEQTKPHLKMATEIPEAADMKKAVTVVKGIHVSRVLTPAVPAKDKNVIMGHNGIPVFEFKKFKARTTGMRVKRVPLLNIGTEAILDSQAFAVIKIEALPSVNESVTKELPSPTVATPFAFREILGDKVIPAPAAEIIEVPILKADQKVTSEKIAALVYNLASDVPYTPLVVVKINAEDLKYLRGLILFEKKDQCHFAAGIFADLVGSQNSKIAENSRYHLGFCLHEMNLPTEAAYHLSKVIRSKDPVLAPMAIKSAVDETPRHVEGEIVEALLSVDQNLIPQALQPRADYLKAKYFVSRGKPEKALEHAVKVPETAKDFYKAQYVASVAEYMLDRVDASLQRQRLAAGELAKSGSDKEVLALFEMNLGRTAFQKGKYRESIEAFQKVPKESTLWMRALQELAWAQLQAKDSAGAIGNMYSIQSPYFNGVFKPESYVVRSIGYLNICQYADAYKSLSILERTYGPWLDKIGIYNQSHGPTQAYDTIVRGLQTKTAQEVDGVPTQAIREVAHQRDFLNYQESVNLIIDENGGYQFIRNLIQKDQRALTARRNATVNKVAELQHKIRTASSTPGAMKNFNAWKFELANNQDFLSVYEFKMATMKEGLEGLNRLSAKAQERLAQRKSELKEQAGHALKTHLVRIAKELRQSLDNNELLKYEIYAGSGENLRYKVAGGKAASPKEVDRKLAGMKWDFDGEYWEDEIGHYRSSLKNNCQNQVAVQPRGE